LKNSLFFSLLAGNRDAETGSIATASATIITALNRLFSGVCRKFICLAVPEQTAHSAQKPGEFGQLLGKMFAQCFQRSKALDEAQAQAAALIEGTIPGAFEGNAHALLMATSDLL
jgi:hypothetical protein